MTISFVEAIRQSLLAHGSATCVVDLGATVDAPRRNLTYAQLHQRASDLAAELRRRVVAEAGASRVIGILARNSSEWLVADLACLFAGYTALPLPLAFSRAQAEHLALSCDGFLLDIAGARTLAERWQLELPERNVILLGEPLPHAELVGPIEVADDWVCKTIHTSGTTSRPKGVRLTVAAVGAVLDSLRRGMPKTAHRVYLSMVPLSLLLEQVTAAYLPLLAGGTTYFLPEQEPLLGEPSASADHLIGWLLDVKPTGMTVPPVMVNRFHDVISLDGSLGAELHDYLTGGVNITCGGAAVSADTMNALACQGIPVFQGYGLSENASVVSMNTAEHQRIGSVGKPLAHVQVRIAADKSIEVKSSSLFSGYSGEDPSACSITSDGWLDTGDLGELDADGYLYVQGRKKNVLCLPNGRNVSPEQVELEFREYPGIRDAAVFLDPRDGLVALIVAEADSEVDLEDLQMWSMRTFSDIERPSRVWLMSQDDPAMNALYTVTGRPKRADIATAYADRTHA